MKIKDIETFRSRYVLIADISLSLDQNYKVILKSRKEISSYIDSKPAKLQQKIIGSLIMSHVAGDISEQWLSDDRTIYGEKYPLENFFRHKVSLISYRVEKAKFEEDNRSIQNLKKEIQALNTDSAKINFLLQKIRDMEGDYPKVLKKRLKKNDIFIFLKRELKFWGKHNELLDKEVSPKTKPLPQLPTNLTREQREILFDLLVKYKFITVETDPESFLWTFGYDKQPNNWQPIKWNYSKQGLRVLLKPILGTITNQHIRDIKKLFLDKNGDPFKLTKNEYRYPNETDSIDKILKSLNIEKTKWYSNIKKPTNSNSV
ncbi:MAG: hypothetical protein WCS51_04975 [Bacilli bacterium]